MSLVSLKHANTNSKENLSDTRIRIVKGSVGGRVGNQLWSLLKKDSILSQDPAAIKEKRSLLQTMRIWSKCKMNEMASSSKMGQNPITIWSWIDVKRQIL